MSLHHGRFGGLWTDQVDAAREIEKRRRAGKLAEGEAAGLSNFVRDGFVILGGAVSAEVIDRLLADLDAAWAGRLPSIHVEHWESGVQEVSLARPELRARPAKLLDLYSESAAAREAIFAPVLRNFLALLFEGPILAFQSLSFQRGTGQPMHQDTAYVVVEGAPLEMAASWIALEDIAPGAGELEYYPGSHRMPEYPFAGGHKNLLPGDPGRQHDHYLAWLHEQAARMGLERRRFRAKRGDALVWAADLAHGGSPVEQPLATRRSLVTHYCPAAREPGYFRAVAHSGRRLHVPGCLYVSPLRLGGAEERVRDFDLG